MLTTFGALAPVFLLIAIGYALRRSGFPGTAFWMDAERLVYWVLFPPLLLVTTAGAELAGFRIGPLAVALIAAILLTAVLTLAIRPWLWLCPPAFTSVFQGAIRNNTYVGLAGAAALFGQAGLAVMGIVVFVVVTTVNLLCVSVLVYYRGGTPSSRQLIVPILQNPLILACLAGFALNALGIGLIETAGRTLEILGSGSLSLALLCVGAGLDLKRLGRHLRPIVITSILKLMVMPATTALCLWLLGVEGLTASVAVLFSACPISASSYVLARLLGGDAPLLASLITITTLAAVLTMPLVLGLLT
jgi:predicted permease